MTDYKPTTEEVRKPFTGEVGQYQEDPERRRQWDRWLADRDRKKAAMGWDAAVKSMRYEDGTPVELVSVVNPYRADRIESEAP